MKEVSVAPLSRYIGACILLVLAGPVLAQSDSNHREPPLRARDLGVPFDGTPGQFNAITDVAGVEVGHTTLISGSGALKVGVGPVRTGVTALFPRGKNSVGPVFAGWFTENGNGEMTGTTWVEESGFLYGPKKPSGRSSASAQRQEN